MENRDHVRITGRAQDVFGRDPPRFIGMLGRIRAQLRVFRRLKQVVMDILMDQRSLFFKPVTEPDVNFPQVFQQTNLIQPQFFKRFTGRRFF